MATPSDGFLGSYLPYVLRRADQTLSAPFYAQLNSYGVARSEWRLLAVLHELGEMGVVDLAAAALSPQPTVTHALRRLEDRKLVRRTPGTLDKRQRLVSITRAGADLTSTLITQAREIEREALTEAGDLTALLTELHALTEAVEQQLQSQTDDAKQAG